MASKSKAAALGREHASKLAVAIGEREVFRDLAGWPSAQPAFVIKYTGRLAKRPRKDSDGEWSPLPWAELFEVHNCRPDDWRRLALSLFIHHGDKAGNQSATVALLASAVAEPPRDPDWKWIAHALAGAHVAAFKPPNRGPGRSRKEQPVQVSSLGLSGVPTSASFGPGLLGLFAKSKGGRPIRWTPERQRELVATANAWKRQAKAEKRSASDRAFVAWLCEQEARRTEKRVSEVRKREGRALAIALSRARKSVSKP